jgi:single-strand DNA-binding protein
LRDESKAQHALPDDGKRAKQSRAEVMAMAINKVIVIGNLGADPVVRPLPNAGQNVANFSLATTERFTDRNGTRQERTEWHRIVVFGRLANTCERFLRKGRQAYIEGRLTTRQYEAKDGSGKRYRTEIVARQLRLYSVIAPTRPSRSVRRLPVLVPTRQRETRESGSPRTIPTTIGDYTNGHLCGPRQTAEDRDARTRAD